MPAEKATAESIAIDGLELEGRLGLVAVQRPADTLAAIGWMGPVTHLC